MAEKRVIVVSVRKRVAALFAAVVMAVSGLVAVQSNLPDAVALTGACGEVNAGGAKNETCSANLYQHRLTCTVTGTLKGDWVVQGMWSIAVMNGKCYDYYTSFSAVKSTFV